MPTTGDITVRRLDPADAASIDLVARRMRATLVEVLDEVRADEMFDHDGLVGRVRWHLDRTDPRRRSEVFVALVDDRLVGHVMVRVDTVDGVEAGLFATSYVVPSARRLGVASALLRTGEAWMRDRGLVSAATFTDAGNERLLDFYRSHGYECRQLDDEWATARRALA